MRNRSEPFEWGDAPADPDPLSTGAQRGIGYGRGWACLHSCKRIDQCDWSRRPKTVWIWGRCKKDILPFKPFRRTFCTIKVRISAKRSWTIWQRSLQWTSTAKNGWWNSIYTFFRYFLLLNVELLTIFWRNRLYNINMLKKIVFPCVRGA